MSREQILGCAAAMDADRESDFLTEVALVHDYVANPNLWPDAMTRYESARARGATIAAALKSC
jgi:hypothetical protein